jgi:hypothetical protein
MRRISLILALVLGAALAFPLVARADQAILAHDALFEVAPGEVVTYSDTLFISRAGIATVMFDGASGFADDETVVATIALRTNRVTKPDEVVGDDLDGLGSMELLSSPTITGTTPADWTTGGAVPQFEFSPAIEFRWTAPVAEELDCDDRPGYEVRTYLAVSATLVGSKGTMASFSAEDFPGTVAIDVTCPVPAPTSETGAPGDATVTPPPTDTRPLDSASRNEWADWLPHVVLVAGAAAVVVLTRVSRPDRSGQR